MSRPSAYRYTRWLSLMGKPIPPQLQRFKPRDAEIAAEHRMRQWFCDHLAATDPLPNQLPDSRLGPYVGLEALAKRGGMRKFFGRTLRHRPVPGGMVVEAEIGCAGVSPRTIEKATQRARRKSVDQMVGHGPPAGHIVKIDSAGSVIRVSMMITDAAAVAKVRHRVYAGAIAEFDGDDLHRLSLVDSDRLAKAGEAPTICEVYGRSGPLKKKFRKAARIARKAGISFDEALAKVERKMRAPVQPQVPASGVAAVDRLLRAQAALSTPGGDQMAKRAELGRAVDGYRLELVKAQRRLIGGEGALISQIRHGRP